MNLNLALLPVIELELIPEESINELKSMVPELNKALETRQIFRTETEARISVLDDMHFPTKAAKYWQTVREQTVMLDQLALMSFEFRRNEIELMRAQSRLQKSEDEFDRMEARVDIDERIYKKQQLQQIAADRIREIKMWSKIKHELDDGSFDTVNVDAHQLTSYTTEFALRAASIDPSQMSEGEFTNLTGQLTTALRRCGEVGVLDKVMSQLPPALANSLVKQLGN